MRLSALLYLSSSEKSAVATSTDAQALRCAPVRGAAAGLVSSKTSDPPFLDVGFARKLVLERRVKRLRRQVWAAGPLPERWADGPYSAIDRFSSMEGAP